MRRRAGLGGVLVLVVALVVVAVVVSSGDEAEHPRGAGASLYDDIPQDGEYLGDPDAPVAMEEFADLQCPFCRQYAAEVLPTLIEEYVRPGRVRMRLRLTTYLGPDSERGARVALAAGLEDRMWQFADDFYRHQGPENSGYASEDFLRARLRAAGLEPDDVLAKRTDPRIHRQLGAVDRAVERHRISGTPMFLLGPRDGRLRLARVRTRDVATFREAIDAALSAAR